MGHCWGGPATDQADLITPLLAWDEEGQAPDSIVATARGAGNVGRQPHTAAVSVSVDGALQERRSGAGIELRLPAGARMNPMIMRTSDHTEPIPATYQCARPCALSCAIIQPMNAHLDEGAWFHPTAQSAQPHQPLDGASRHRRTAYFSPSWTPFQADRGRHFSVIVDGVSV